MNHTNDPSNPSDTTSTKPPTAQKTPTNANGQKTPTDADGLNVPTDATAQSTPTDVTAQNGPTTQNAPTDAGQLNRRSDPSDQHDERPLREVVASQLRSMILEGELTSGERLVEGHLAALLGVSRNPIREAIRSLEAAGLIEVIPRRGAYVTAIDHDEVNQIQQIRILVEGYAVEQAAMRRTPEGLERIRECLEQGRLATERGDAVTAAGWHREFHLAIEHAARIPCLEQVLNPLRHQTEMVFSVITDKRGYITWEEHEAIYNAVAARDSEKARILIGEHIMNALESFEQAAGAAGNSRN